MKDARRNEREVMRKGEEDDQSQLKRKNEPKQKPKNSAKLTGTDWRPGAKWEPNGEAIRAAKEETKRTKEG